MKKKLIAIATLAAVSLGSVGILAGCGGGDSSASGAAQVDSGALTVGSSASVDNWDFTLDSIEIADHYENKNETYSLGHTADEGMTFLIFHLTVKNNNSEAGAFAKAAPTNGTRVKVYYKNDYQYDSVNLVAIHNDLHNLSIKPLQTTEGILAVEVPKDITDFDNLKFQIIKSGQEITFDLKGYQPAEETVSSAAAASSSSAASSAVSSEASSTVSSEASSAVSSESSSKAVSSEAASSKAEAPAIAVDDSMLNKTLDVSTVFPGKTKLTVSDLETLFNQEENNLIIITNEQAAEYNKETVGFSGNEVQPQAIAVYQSKYELGFALDENDTASQVFISEYVGGHGIGGF